MAQQVIQIDQTSDREGRAANGAARTPRRTMMAIEHATKHYKTRTGSVHALEDLTLDIGDGEFVCVVGPSGCGKNTSSGRCPGCTT